MGNTEQNIKRFLTNWWPIGIIFTIWLLFAQPYILKGFVPFPSKYLVTFFPPWSAAYGMPVKNNAMPDVITQIYPWKKLTIDTWKLGEVPLWNPYSFSGTPLLANYQSAVFSPMNLLFFFMNQIDAWSWLVLLQPLLAGLFLYMYLRTLGRSQSGSTIGSLAFMFSGFIVVWMAYGTLGYAVLWLPLTLLAIHKYFKTKVWWYGLLISASLALSFLSGHFQISLYVSLFSFAYIFYQGRISGKWRPTVRAFLFFLAGIALSSPQIFPSLAAYERAVRSVSFTKGEIIPWNYLITFFAPDFYGNPVTRNDWFGHYAEWAGFIGVAPLLLALLTLTRKKTKEEMFFFIVGAAALLFALPTPLTDALFVLRIPVLSTSAASRIIVVASFSLAVLSAYGFDGLGSFWKTKDYDRVKKLSIVVIIFLVFLWGALELGKPLSAEKLIVARRNSIFPTLMVLAAVSSLWIGFRGGLTKKVGTALLIGITAIDMLRFAAKWMPFDPREYMYPDMPVVAFLQQSVGISRVFGNFGNELATTFRIPSVEGYDALYPRRYGEFVSALADGKIRDIARSVVVIDKAGKYTEDALRLLGVRYLVHRTSDGRNIWAYPFWKYPDYQSVYKDAYFEIFENTKAYPRAFLASSYVLGQNSQDILSKLFDSTIDRRQTVVLEDRPSIEPQAGDGDVAIELYKPTYVRLRTSSLVPKLLFLSDAYDEGWKTTIDGRPAGLLRADYVFRSVALPAGNHTVEFRYQPQTFTLGLVVAGVTVVLLLVGSIKIGRAYARSF